LVAARPRSRTLGCARSAARGRLGLVASAWRALRLDSTGRARRGTSGALNLQSAPAGLKSLPRSPASRAAPSGDVEDRVPRSGDSRTVSGPEGSSTKRCSSGAADRPGPSRPPEWVRGGSDRRRVHGTLRPRPAPERLH